MNARINISSAFREISIKFPIDSFHVNTAISSVNGRSWMEEPLLMSDFSLEDLTTIHCLMEITNQLMEITNQLGLTATSSNS